MGACTSATVASAHPTPPTHHSRPNQAPGPPPQCDVFVNQISDTWKVRVSIIVYAMAIVATVGWVLFMVFGAIGLVALPIDWIRAFIGRPKATITRSQYIDRARDLARRAKEILALADALKREERERGRSWRWRRNAKALNTQLLVLEEDEAELEMVYPQASRGGWGWGEQRRDRAPPTGSCAPPLKRACPAGTLCMKAAWPTGWQLEPVM